MYYEYWGLTKHPFNNVPDPSMYFPMHETVENTVAELLFAIEEGDECLAVVVGEIGLGKTMALRVVLDSLDPEKYAIAFVTNPDLTFPQILREIIGQLTKTECQLKAKDKLLEEFHRLLFATADQGKRVVIFIDEGNALRPVNLESLRLLTNMQEDDRNLFTLILAGQPQLAQRLEMPRMANLFQRIGVYCKITKLKSLELMKDYIEHRLERAGARRKIFTEDAFDQIWIHSEEGVPRLVNKLCKLSLKAGETNRLEFINGAVIQQVAERFTKFKTRLEKREHRAHLRHEQAAEGVASLEQAEIAAQLSNEPREVKPTLSDVDRKVIETLEALDAKAQESLTCQMLDTEDDDENRSMVRGILDRMKERYRGTSVIKPFYR